MLGKQGKSLYKTHLIVLCILCACLFAIFNGIYDIDPKLAFMIDSVHLPVRGDIGIGEGSTVCYSDVPTDYLKLNPEDDGTFSWQIDSLHHQDSLMYFKVNDQNPQKYAIEDNQAQVIQLNIPGGPAFSITGHDIWNEWRSFKKQKDVLLRHFAAWYGSLRIAASDSVKDIWRGVINDVEIRSFLARTESGISLVILDRHTQIQQEDGHIDRYRYYGRTKQDPSTQGRCKVQFFRVSSYCYNEGEESSDWFQIDTINYVMKPSVILTGWGAGHVMLDARSGEGIDLHYPKALGYVGTLDSLRSSSLGASHIITFKQQSQSFPTRTDIYLPQLSSAMPQDLCSIELNDSVLIRDNNNSVSKVTSRRLWKVTMPFFNKVKLSSGRAYLNCRVGFVDSQFALGYLLLPLIVALLLIFLVLYPRSCTRVDLESSTYEHPFYCGTQLSSYPRYLSILILIGLCYAFCKSLIALKLSYTYPYFEKLSGITPVSSSLFLLLFFTFAMVINTQLMGSNDLRTDSYGYDSVRKHGSRKWFAWMGAVAIFVGLAYVLFRILDQEVSSGILSSYFSHDLRSFNPLSWRDLYGINDNHRSVPFTQLLIELVLLVIWFGQNLYWQFDKVKVGVAHIMDWLKGSVQKVQEVFTSLVKKVLVPVAHFLDTHVMGNSSIQSLMNFAEDNSVYGMIIAVVLVGIALLFPFLRIPLWIAAVVIAVLCLWNPLKLALKNLFPWHFVIFLVLAFGGKMLGNFGTAFITLIVILGLCRSLTSVVFTPLNRQSDIDNRHTVFFEMIIISLLYIAFAMIADNGYVTNYVGILTAVICFYYIYDRNTFLGMPDVQNYDKESKWTVAVTIFAALFAFLLPNLCSYLFDPSQVHYNRLSRRVMLYSDFERQQESGYRYAESDTEFMAIMSHYMQMESDRHQCDDPLCNEGHFLHPSISTGQSPVVLNDLSVPVAFIGAYGVGRASAIFFLLLLALFIHVIRFSMAYSSEDNDPDSYLTYATQWRLLALFMWIGTSFYIYMSYIGFIPFTGRLIPGFGVDSVGEALESAILLAFMAAVTLRAQDKTDPTPD